MILYYNPYSTPNNRYNVRGASGRFASRSGGNSRSSSLDNTSQDGDAAEEYDGQFSSNTLNLSPSIRVTGGSCAAIAKTDIDDHIKMAKGKEQRSKQRREVKMIITSISTFRMN